MDTIGQLVQQSMDLSDRWSFELAFLPACRALKETAEKEFKDSNLMVPADQEFIRKHWHFIYFASITRPTVLPPNLPFRLRRAVP